MNFPTYSEDTSKYSDEIKGKVKLTKSWKYLKSMQIFSEFLYHYLALLYFEMMKNLICIVFFCAKTSLIEICSINISETSFCAKRGGFWKDVVQ